MMNDNRPANGQRYVTWREWTLSTLTVATALVGLGAVSFQTHASGTHAASVRQAEYQRTTESIAKQLDRLQNTLDKLIENRER